MKRSILFGVFGVLLGAVAVFSATTWDTLLEVTGSGSRRDTVEISVTAPAVGSAANLQPGAASTNDLGTSSLYWEDVWTERVAFAVAVDTTTAPPAAGAIAINASNTLYISTGTGAGAWVAVGSQS